MRRKMMDVQDISVTVSLGGSSGTQDDYCNPLRGTLRKVEVYCANDASVGGMKVELERYDNTKHAYVAIYTGNNEMILDDSNWNNADPGENLDIALSFAKDGNYRWKITPDAAPGADMAVKIRRTIEC
jgi:uncharacterized cupredoxin-like copper-binding protein